MPKRLTPEQRKLKEQLDQLDRLVKQQRAAKRAEEKATEATEAEILRHRRRLARSLRKAERWIAESNKGIEKFSIPWTCEFYWRKGGAVSDADRLQKLRDYSEWNVRESASADRLRTELAIFDQLHGIVLEPAELP